MKDVDRAVATYKDRLAQTAELAPGDVAEIEDHLRTLIEDLRASGVPLAHAIEQAAQRLGEPAQVAREHARVRTPFGARLSRLRTWSALALIAPMTWLTLASSAAHEGVVSVTRMEGVLVALAAIALIARVGWARPILLGGMAFCALTAALPVIALSGQPTVWLAADLGVLAFVWPWRRGELSAPGIALALQIFSVATAMWMLRSTGAFAVIAQVAAAFALAACAGCLARARWSAFAAAGAAACLALEVIQLGATPLFADTRIYALLRAGDLALLGSGVLAGAAGAALAWRTSRMAVARSR